MQNHDAALAHGQAYELFSHLWGRGINAETLPYGQAVPQLSAALPPNPDFDLLAADHYQMFGMNVFPFEAMFLNTDNLLGSTSTESVAAFLAECGFTAWVASDSADHIANELALLAFLSWAEADAHEDSAAGQAQRMRFLQLRFMNEHLLRWLPVLTMGVRAASAAGVRS